MVTATMEDPFLTADIDVPIPENVVMEVAILPATSGRAHVFTRVIWPSGHLFREDFFIYAERDDPSFERCYDLLDEHHDLYAEYLEGSL